MTSAGERVHGILIDIAIINAKKQFEKVNTLNTMDFPNAQQYMMMYNLYWDKGMEMMKFAEQLIEADPRE